MEICVERFVNINGSFLDAEFVGMMTARRYADNLSFVMMIDHRHRGSHTLELTRALYLFYTVSLCFYSGAPLSSIFLRQ